MLRIGFRDELCELSGRLEIDSRSEKQRNNLSKQLTFDDATKR